LSGEQSMTQQALSSYVFTSKYARTIPEQHRRETLPEAGKRMFDMHRKKYAGMGVDDEIDFAEAAFLDGLVLGSQRALQYGGDCIERHNLKLYNCCTSYCDRPRFFQEAVFLLLCGCGVGFSVQQHHVAKLPQIAPPKGNGSSVIHTIDDSIEGWADAFGALLSSYFIGGRVDFPQYRGRYIEFDFSLIRPEGALIRSSGCKAPGPEPLKRALEKARDILERACAEGDQLRPIHAYDIVMHESDAVLSGGVRRSASISLFSPEDQEMMTAKIGDWMHKNPQRGRSNNSVLLLREKTQWGDFQRVLNLAREWGEPGFVFGDDTEIVYNPCLEIGMWPVCSETGESGWQMCNLSTLNMARIYDDETFRRATRAAAIIGTLQAGYTDFAYLGPVSERITRREALLGVSMTGMMDSPDVAFDPALQEEMAKLVLAVNKELAPKLGVNLTARATCLKPEGTGSCVLKSASGIHGHHARRVLRRVQANINEPAYQLFKMHNLRACEKSVWDPNGKTEVITFLIEPGKDALTKAQVGAIGLLERVLSTKKHWVDAGKVPSRCTQPWLSHNVSNTVEVGEGEWEKVGRFIYENRLHLAGVSLLPASGDLDYPQAPFVAVPMVEEVVAEYGNGAIMASGLIVDGQHAYDGNLWDACEHALGLKTLEDTKLEVAYDIARTSAERAEEKVERLLQSRGASTLTKEISAAVELAQQADEIGARVERMRLKKDWIRRANQFAERHFEGDVRKMTRCLKHVNNIKLWEDLKREFVDVDYAQMAVEDDTNDHIQGTVACAGGQCEIL